MTDTKKYHALLLKAPHLEESMAIEMTFDAHDEFQAQVLAGLIAKVAGYAIEQVREL